MTEYNPESQVLGTPYVYDKGISPLVAKIDERVRILRSQGKLTPEVLKQIQTYFRIKNIHHSNAIEGNRLDYGETRMVVEQGLTITGKPLKDTLEAKNLAHAMDFFEELASKTDKPITAHDVRQIHAAILQGIDDNNGGKYRLSDVEISGSQYKPPTYIRVPDEMEKLCNWLEQITTTSYEAKVSPVVLACAAHTWFVYIHPFVDGNGRTARILMNLVLMRHGYPISIVTRDDRARYYDALEASHSSDLTPFISLVTDTLEESLDEYERAVRDQLDKTEWARSLTSQIKTQQENKIRVQYDIWRSAMELLRSSFKQTVDTWNEVSADIVTVFFTGYDVIDFEKYLSAQQGIIIKRSWFFRLDFVSGQTRSRYMFFFGLPSNQMRVKSPSDVSVLISREETPFFYERLDQIHNHITPQLREITYSADNENFICRYEHNALEPKKVEVFGREFIEEAIRIHIVKA
ncbi:MAG: Fic family protein [Chloroflexi bacterium]|nr:Fic family protein [Chloroflexota bacterium]